SYDSTCFSPAAPKAHTAPASCWASLPPAALRVSPCRPISPGLSSASVPTAISSTCRSKLSLPQRSRKPSAEPHAHRPPRRIPASLIGHGDGQAVFGLDPSEPDSSGWLWDG